MGNQDETGHDVSCECWAWLNWLWPYVVAPRLRYAGIRYSMLLDLLLGAYVLLICCGLSWMSAWHRALVRC